MDNKVVSLTSSLEISGDAPVNRRSGSNVLSLIVDKGKGWMEWIIATNKWREKQVLP